MLKTLLITGGNGMLAQHLEKQFSGSYNIRFLSRKPRRDYDYLWCLKNKYIDPKALEDVDIIIHLAGASIFKKPWSTKRKQIILSSRVDSTLLLLEELKKRKQNIETFICASGVGYYGAITSNDVLHEQSPEGNDFLSFVCSKWENAANAFRNSGIAHNVVVVRIGVILSERGGALEKLSKSIKYGLGSVMGSGNQHFAWVHIEDLSNMLAFILKNNLFGTYNAVSPGHINHRQLVKAISKVLCRPIFLPNIPNFFVRLLLGKRALLLLDGSRVSSEKIQKQGFKFKYKTIKTAIESLLKK